MENTSAESIQKYADTYLSEQEQEMFKFLEESYGLTRDEFCSIVLWLDNFGLKFDSVERFESVEDSLVKEFGLTSDDIFSIMFSHGDVFCKEFSDTSANFEFLENRYGITKKDFGAMLKSSCLIDKKQIRDLEFKLKSKFPSLKWIPMAEILKNTIEQVNGYYDEEIAYKINLLEKFGITLDFNNGKFGFLKIPVEELSTRLKLMHLTNEFPFSFLSVGHTTSNSKAYKLFLRFQAEAVGEKKVKYEEKLKRRKKYELFDETKPMSEEDIKFVSEKFAEKFGKIAKEVSQFEAQSKPKAQAQVVQEDANSNSDPIESGKEISYITNGGVQVKKAKNAQGLSKQARTPYVKISPEHKRVWTHMVNNFGLTYGEYPKVAETVDPAKNNRLKQNTADIEAVFEEVSKDYQVTREQFGQFFKHTLYGMPLRLALLECFGIIPQDLANNDYKNASILNVDLNPLEYMLKIVSLGRVDLEQNLHRIVKYQRRFLLAKYIKFVESGAEGNMLDISMTEEEYREYIETKNPSYKKDRVIEKAYAERFPVSNSFLEGFKENQRSLMIMIGFLVKHYGVSYAEAKEAVLGSSKIFNDYANIIRNRLENLEKFGFDPAIVIKNPKILGLPQERATYKAVFAKYLGLDEEAFLKHYIATDEAKVFARMMGAVDIKPSYYYASEKVFRELTGLSTEALMAEHKLTIGQFSELKRKIYKEETKKQIEAILSVSSEPNQIINGDNLATAFSNEEIELMKYFQINYKIERSEFNKLRHVVGQSGLTLMNLTQVEKLLPILKREFEIFGAEEIAELFKNTPTMFSNRFVDLISRYPYLEETFDISRDRYKKILLRGEAELFFRDDLLELYEELREKILSEFGVVITRQSFIHILRNIKCDKDSDITRYVQEIFRLLKNYQVDPKQIKERHNFMRASNLQVLETRLMLKHILNESSEDFYRNNFNVDPSIFIERFLLYVHGEIPKDSLFLRKAEFKELTGIDIKPTTKVNSQNRLEIARLFAQKHNKVSFAPSDEIYGQKLETKADDEIVIRSNDYLTYMLARILNVDYKLVVISKRRNSELEDVYARFMGVGEFLFEPKNYYLPEERWQELAGVSTAELKKMYPLTPETAEIIKRAYFEKYPEEAFGGELGQVENTEVLEETNLQQNSGE